MDQQPSGGSDERSSNATSQQQQQPQSPRSRSSADDTWGIGSSSAMDRLRERNYRGRRNVTDRRPAPE